MNLKSLYAYLLVLTNMANNLFYYTLKYNEENGMEVCEKQDANVAEKNEEE